MHVVLCCAELFLAKVRAIYVIVHSTGGFDIDYAGNHNSLKILEHSTTPLPQPHAHHLNDNADDDDNNRCGSQNAEGYLAYWCGHGKAVGHSLTLIIINYDHALCALDILLSIYYQCTTSYVASIIMLYTHVALFLPTILGSFTRCRPMPICSFTDTGCFVTSLISAPVPASATVVLYS